MKFAYRCYSLLKSLYKIVTWWTLKKDVFCERPPDNYLGLRGYLTVTRFFVNFYFIF